MGGKDGATQLLQYDLAGRLTCCGGKQYWEWMNHGFGLPDVEKNEPPLVKHRPGRPNAKFEVFCVTPLKR